MRRITRASLAALLATHVIVALYGIAQPLRWGHYGFHVAEHGLGARNLARWGIWEFTTYYGLGRPPPSSYNFHHAARLHIPVALMQSLLGDAPWVSRLIPLLLGCLSVLGVFAFARRARGDLQAVLVTGLFVLSPVHVAYANLPDLQLTTVGAMAWFGYFAQRLASGDRRPARVGLLVAGAVGGFADWAWYPILCLTSVALLAYASPRRRDAHRLDDDTARYLRHSLWMFAGVSVAIVAQHFLRAWHYGVLRDLTNTYGQRSGGIVPFVRDFLVQRLVMNHTAPVLVAALAWPALAWRARRRDVGTLVVASYLVGQTLYMFKFPTEFCAHEYRSYLLAMPLVFAASEVVTPAAARVRAWARDGDDTAMAYTVGAVLVALIAQVPTAYFMAELSRERSGSTSARRYDPHDRDAAAAKVLRALSTRDGIVVLGPGAPLDRIEVAYEFDRLASVATAPVHVFAPPAHRGSLLLLTDEAHVVDPAWRALMRRARIALLDGRAIVDVTPGVAPSVEEMRWSIGDSYNTLERYLHAPVEGPMLLRAGDAAHARNVALALGHEAKVVERAGAGRTPMLDALPGSLRSAR